MWQRNSGNSGSYSPAVVESDQPETAAPEPDYRDLGEHVAGLLKAAKEAAEKIRRDAQRQAAEIRRRAEEDAARELGRAAKRRQDADGEAQQMVADAETEASEMIESANRSVEETLEEGRRGQEAIREETRSLEDSRRRVIRELRDLAGLLGDLLAEMPEPSDAESSTVALATAEGASSASFWEESELAPEQDQTRNGGKDPAPETVDTEGR